MSPKSDKVFSFWLIVQISPEPSFVMITGKLKERGQRTLHVSDFHCCNKMSKISNLKRNKVYFGSQFWVLQSVSGLPHCFWAYSKTV